jgi:curved DNA-binding protein CbpA
MASSAFSPDWIKQFPDPYAVLGVSVTADERRISKRYRQVAKRLHPDQQIQADEESRLFSSQILTTLVNPAYQRLKLDKGRAETLATLRFKVRRLSREHKLVATGPLAKQLIDLDESEVEIFYEKALVELSETQYHSADVFAQQTQAIAELNLVYLRRKMGDPVIREKRTGLVSATAVQSPVAATAPKKPVSGSSDDSSHISYAQRHVMRAKTYIASKCYQEAVQELRDAVRIEPENSNYHTMLGQAYLLQKMTGMAKVHIRQALKLDPNNLVARKYAKQLDLDLSQRPQSSHAKDNGQSKPGGLFKFFSQKRVVK